MHIGLLIYGALDTLSGGYLYDRKLVETLERLGDNVEVISLPWRSYARHLLDNCSTSLLRRLEHFSGDVLIQDELNHPSLFWLNRRLKPRVSYPLVSIVHHLRSSELRPAWQNCWYARVEHAYLTSIDGFIFNSQATRLACRAACRTATRQVVTGVLGQEPPHVVAYPGGDRLAPHISTAQITQRAHQPGPLRLFFLGNLIPRKGLHTLLDALRLVPQDLWRLEIAGRSDLDPAYARTLARQAAAQSSRVRFLGALDDAELARRLADSHLLVVPSSYEGFGIVYLEGMGFGLPVIATSAGAAAEIITPGENGLLITPGDATQLSGHIHQLALDRPRLAAMGQAARLRYAAHPTWEQSTSQIHAFLHRFTANFSRA